MIYYLKKLLLVSVWSLVGVNRTMVKNKMSRFLWFTVYILKFVAAMFDRVTQHVGRAELLVIIKSQLTLPHWFYNKE